jgi:small subunit ribosomal protein S15
MLTKKKKQAVIKKTARHEKDTGSPEVQISILSERVSELTRHLKENKNDLHSRRGLLKLVADRRAHMKYLEKKNAKSFKEVVKKVGLK